MCNRVTADDSYLYLYKIDFNTWVSTLFVLLALKKQAFYDGIIEGGRRSFTVQFILEQFKA